MLNALKVALDYIPKAGLNWVGNVNELNAGINTAQSERPQLRSIQATQQMAMLELKESRP